MTKNWFSTLVILALFGLLVLLATLQYRWVGQIGDSERTRLTARLKDDTLRFAEDFNREIQSVYFAFQLDPKNIEYKDWRPFTKRFVFWKTISKNPELVQDFYFVRSAGEELPLRYKLDKAEFSESDWTNDLRKIHDAARKTSESIPVVEFQTDSNKAELALVVPVLEKAVKPDEVVIRKNLGTEIKTRELEISRVKTIGFLIIILDEDVVRNEILTKLSAKYFSGGNDGSYNISIVNSYNRTVFQTGGKIVDAPDATNNIFDLRPRDFAFFPEETGNTIIESQIREGQDGNVVVSETYLSNSSSPNEKNENVDVSLKQIDDKKTKIAVFNGSIATSEGVWALNVQHSSGSIEAFVAQTRFRNLLVSFGILALLALSMLLIFVLSQRSKMLAQRQIDFVSSVSHEFRTPISVIYSAGENLSDGLIGGPEKTVGYGNLIKNEGKKLSVMVEQILEFAGAQSGKRRYEFQQVNIENIIAGALAECDHAINLEKFQIEKEIEADLPRVFADEKALTQAFQNIINNSMKYSNGNKWLKVSAGTKGTNLEVSFEDQGIGISSKDKKHLFEPFYRADEAIDSQISGNGLGLSLVKQVIDDHRGSVRVESEIGSGSRFIIRLPIYEGRNSKISNE